LHTFNQDSTNIRRLLDCSLRSRDVVILDNNKVLLVDCIGDWPGRESKHTAVVAACKDHHFVSVCEVSSRHQRVEIGFRARISEAHSINREAFADQ
jgi:hypothetical protein